MEAARPVGALREAPAAARLVRRRRRSQHGDRERQTARHDAPERARCRSAGNGGRWSCRHRPVAATAAPSILEQPSVDAAAARMRSVIAKAIEPAVLVGLQPLPGGGEPACVLRVAALSVDGVSNRLGKRPGQRHRCPRSCARLSRLRRPACSPGSLSPEPGPARLVVRRRRQLGRRGRPRACVRRRRRGHARARLDTATSSAWSRSARSGFCRQTGCSRSA